MPVQRRDRTAPPTASATRSRLHRSLTEARSPHHRRTNRVRRGHPRIRSRDRPRASRPSPSDCVAQYRRRAPARRLGLRYSSLARTGRTPRGATCSREGWRVHYRYCRWNSHPETASEPDHTGGTFWAAMVTMTSAVRSERAGAFEVVTITSPSAVRRSFPVNTPSSHEFINEDARLPWYERCRGRGRWRSHS